MKLSFFFFFEVSGEFVLKTIWHGDFLETDL